MEPLSEDFKARMLATVEQWAARRYGARLKDIPAEHYQISRSGSASDADYIVSLDALVGSAPLRVKVVVGPDGEFHIHD